MRKLLNGLLGLGSLLLAGLLNYELAAKSQQWLGRPLPGWQESCQVERATPVHRWTGLAPIDRLLHEGEEAVAYYDLLLHPRNRRSAGPAVGTPLPALDVLQES
jgi:hypothetical protein